MKTKGKTARTYPHRVRLQTGEFRYSIQWDEARLNRAVKAATENKSGKATLGPITIYVHPEDRLP